MEDPALFDPKKFEEPKAQPVVVEETVADEVETTEQVPEPVQAQQAQSVEQKHFKALRDKMSRTEQERDSAMQRIRELESARQQQEEPEQDILLGDDEIAEGKHISKVNKEVKKLKQQLQQYQRQSAEAIAEATLKAKYPDFDSVVNAETVDALRSAHPEIAATINSNPDLLTKAAAAYKIIKQLGIGQPDIYEADRERVQKNAAKPKPVNTVAGQGESPLAKADAFANGLTDDVREQLRKEMNQYRKNF